VYVETGFKLAGNIMKNSESNLQNVSYMFLDRNDQIIFSELPDVFQPDGRLEGDALANFRGSYKGYYWFKVTNDQGWSIVSVISEADFNEEKNQWYLQVLLLSMVVLGGSLFLGWLIWKMVYRPLHNFNSQIKRMTTRTHDVPVTTKIPEFDYILNQFSDMKNQIWDLFAEVKIREKHKSDLEIEKLMYQINPHFLLNTLYTVQWLAVMNGQHDIERFVLSLNKLLVYNLGKLGEDSTIRQELDALQHYLTLQKIRYDFEFDVQMDVDEPVLDTPVPRFILQPIVENSLYHGFTEDGRVEISIYQAQRLEITIRDNGSGMTEDTLEQLLNDENEARTKTGMGIGLNYVKRVIEAKYGLEADLTIKSKLGHGTEVILRLPIQKGEKLYD